MIKCAFFDLDGTLTDPKLGLTNSIYYGLTKFGVKVDSKEELKKYIGPELVPAFMSDYGMSKEEAYETLGYFREYFSTKGIFENVKYPGIDDMLKKLKEKGILVGLATSKPEPYAIQILEHFDLIKYFDFVCGNNMEETRGKKKDIIEFLINEIKNPDITREDIVMVGDRQYDILGAKEVGTKSIGVLYGYGSLEELSNVNPDYIVSSVKELEDKLLSL